MNSEQNLLNRGTYKEIWNWFRIGELCPRKKLSEKGIKPLVTRRLNPRPWHLTCGIFQIYFYNNLFNPDLNRKTENKTNKQTNKKLTKRTVETFLNQLFFLNNQNKSKETMEHYAREQNITVTCMKTVLTCTRANKVSLSNIVDR